MKVYEFVYNECIYEGSAATLSIHKTRSGAEKALIIHKAKEYKDWVETLTDNEKNEFPFGYSEFWSVRETEVQP